MLKVSVLIPSIRPEALARCIEHIKKNAGLDPDEYEILVDTETVGSGHAFNALVARSQAPVICALGDDTLPQEGFLSKGLAHMTELPDGWGIVALPDGTGRKSLPVHFLADKRMIPLLGGELLHTGYKHCFADQELGYRAILMRKYAYAEDVLVIHDNPVLTGKPLDDSYKKFYSPEWMNHDHDLYQKRKASNWTYTNPKGE